jgi:hypothetical protein
MQPMRWGIFPCDEVIRRAQDTDRCISLYGRFYLAAILRRYCWVTLSLSSEMGRWHDVGYRWQTYPYRHRVGEHFRT